jgi:glycolate oxidase iron-sulfur subunit
VKHEIPVDEIGPNGAGMAEAVSSCVHCGFCLSTCPTYVTMAEEMDSPRGRIFLMKEVLEGKTEIEVALPYIDNCLGCQACTTSCPSGVSYGDLITPFRAYAETRRTRSPADRVTRAMTLRLLPKPKRFRLAARLGMAVRPFAGVLPGSMRNMLEMLPAELPDPDPLPAIYPAQGIRRARVALLAGCAQQVLDPDINWATLRVLARNGIETVTPKAQACCGALAMHTGEAEQARNSARKNLSAFPEDVDAIITTAAGCGSGLKEYGQLFKGEPEQEQAEELSARCVDTTVFLAEIGLETNPPDLEAPLRIAYQDACHLGHAQGVRTPPRELLASIPGVELAEHADWAICCGSAGTYNIEKPEIAAQLGRRKAEALVATGAELVATGNIGCLTQLKNTLASLEVDLPVLHTMQVLDRAYRTTLGGEQ